MKRSFTDPQNGREVFEKRMCLVDRNETPFGVRPVNPAIVGKKSPEDIVQLVTEIQKANEFVKTNACGKLQVISQQMSYLQHQARQVFVKAKRDADLHHIACNFVKVPGNVYYLYERLSGQKYFGMLSPNEWDSPHAYLGSFRLEHNHSWSDSSEQNEQPQLPFHAITNICDEPMVL